MELDVNFEGGNFVNSNKLALILIMASFSATLYDLYYEAIFFPLFKYFRKYHRDAIVVALEMSGKLLFFLLL